MTNVNSYRGYSLFKDIEDFTLRTRNRAVVLANIAEAHVKNKLISPKGAALILGYYNQVEMDEREAVMNRFKISMEERGFKLQ